MCKRSAIDDNMSVCDKCNKRITKFKIVCSKCDKTFHARCVNLSAEDTVLKENQVWCCNNCTGNAKAMDTPSVTDLYKLVLSIKDDLTNLKKWHHETENDVGKSLNLIHEKLDDNSALIGQQSKRLNKCLEEIEHLKSENSLLKNKLQEAVGQLDELNQYGRRNTLEIYGVPETTNENPVEIVKDIGRALNVEVKDEMIDTCHRMKKLQHSTSGGIIVRFVRRIDKDTFLQRRKVKRNFNMSHLGGSNNDPIYINQSLTPLRKLVLSQARRLKNERDYAFLWVDNAGNIKLKIREGDQSVHILNSVEAITKLKEHAYNRG